MPSPPRASRFACPRDLQEACASTAITIARCLRVPHEDGSLRGAAGALLLFHALGAKAPPVSKTLLRGWEESLMASVLESEPSFDGGSPGASWALAILDRHPQALQSIDAAILDLLTDVPWDGGLGTLAGGLACYALYGYARRHTESGPKILRLCLEHVVGIADRSGDTLRWSLGSDMLPGGSVKKRRRKDKASVTLLNMEASAAMVASLALAVKAGLREGAKALEKSALALAEDVRSKPDDLIGMPTFYPVPGTLHGSATWAEGSSGAAAALLSAATAIPAPTLRERTIAFGRDIANLDPRSSHARDGSLALGSSGIACIMHAYADATGQNLFKYATEHWYRKVLAEQTAEPTEADPGFRYLDVTRATDEGGAHWVPRSGYTEGATGTALALLCAVDVHRVAARSIVWPSLGLWSA